MQHDGGPSTLHPSEIVASWPKGSFVENLAVDAEGAIFMTLHTEGAVVRFDPETRAVTPFATFPGPVAGLVIAADGILYVSGGRPGQAPGMIWKADREGGVSRLAELPDALFLNGMALHPDGRRLLVAESIGGKVHSVDPDDGKVEVWMQDAALRPAETDAMTPGVNGVKLHQDSVYVSVTGRDRVLRAPILPDGSPGPLEIVAEKLRADDFAVGPDGSLYIATHPACSLVRLRPDGTRCTLAGSDEGLTGATAVAFGRTERDRGSVYVTTTGGTMTLPSEALETAKLVRVDDVTEPATEQDRNRRLVARHFDDFVNRRDLAAIDRNMTEDFLDHDGPQGVSAGREDDKAMMARMHARFPDLNIALHDLLAEGDKVLVRASWTGTDAASGQRMANRGFVLWRLAGGKIVERWATVTPMQAAAPGETAQVNGSW